MSETIRDDIPQPKDYVDELKSQLKDAKNFSFYRENGVEMRQRLRKKISDMQDNKASDPDKYQKLSEKRINAYKEMRELEYKYQELYDEIIEAEDELEKRWQPEEEVEDIFDVDLT